MSDQTFLNPEYQVPNTQPINDASPAVLTPPTTSLPANDLSSVITTSNPKKKLILILALVGAAILLTGSGVWAYFTYFPTPEKVITKSLTNLSSITSVEYESVTFLEGDPANFMPDLGVSANQPKSGSSKASATLTLKGAYDTQQSNNSSSWFTISLLSKGLLGSDFYFGIESRFINKVIYTNFTDVPNLGFIDLSKLKNQWMKIDLEEIAKKFGKGDEIKKAEESTQITPEQKQKIKAALESANIISITEKMPTEDINGEPSYHYRFIINQTGLKQLITTLGQILNESKDDSGNQAMASAISASEDLLNAAKEMPAGELWIGKRDYLPRKIMFTGSLHDSSGKAIDANYKFTFTFKNFNKPIVVEVPASSRNAEEVLQEALGPLMSGLLGTKDQESSLFGYGTDSDSDKLPDALEAKLGTDPLKADTDGDGYDDGTEVVNNYNPKGTGKLSDADQGIIAEALGFNKTSLEQARQKARDNKRVSDIRQIQMALELYFNENNLQYPAGKNIILGENGAMVLTSNGFSNNTANSTTYMSLIPQNPTPGGTNYIYSQTNNGSNYTLTFSLEEATNEYTAGPHTASANGTTGEIPPPDYNPSQAPTYSLTTPKGRDDKRLSDIKHIQNSLESYYNDHMEYPNHKNLILGSTNANVFSGDGFSNGITTGAIYMEDVPSNPTPNGTSYIYNRIDGDHYTITFSLEADSNTLKAGSHTATQNGIQ